MASRSRRAFSAAALFGGLLVAPGTAVCDPAAGERLAAAHCVSCHASTELIHATLPWLEGQPKAAFIAQWNAFRERKRTVPAMVSLAQQFSEQQVNDLAEYYATLRPPRGPASAGDEAGRALAVRLRCADCHGPGFQGSAAGVARLAGQKARYLVWSMQLMRAGTRSHGSAASPDPLFADLSNAEIESLAAHVASLR
jgi:cytochrome c553